MQSVKKPYKNFNKVNKKKKQIAESETGELVKFNSKQRIPVICLPEIPTVHIDSVYRRFVNNGGAVSGNIAIQDLLNQFLVATTSVLASCYVRQVRIKKVRCLSPVTTQGTSVTLSMQPSGIDSSINSFTSVCETYIDTSASIDVPAYISLTPSIKTPLGSWHYNTNVSINLLNIQAPQGSTLDILFEYILNANNTTSSYTRTIAAATAGTLYATNILTNFVPSGVSSI